MLIGKKLGRYTIKSLIGSGGMGEVYVARDEQLDRDIALKILLAEFSADEERVRRFKYEAKAVSALNHPNIITIHEITEVDDKLFIATEFIDGQTLREEIESKKLTTYEAVKIAEQIADALSVAHKAGIIHRDVKPENIMIRKDGYAKILDFGLAKPLFQNSVGAEDATVQLVKTQPGLVMGSVNYMSPEQARGKTTDERTDIWSLGVVLYEMVTGKNPFGGETISDSLAALIHNEPEFADDIPLEIKQIVQKSLNKNPDERYRKMADFAFELKDLRMRFERDSYGHDNQKFINSGNFAKQDTSENKTLIHNTQSAENVNSDANLVDNKTQVNTISIPKKSLYMPLAILGIIAVLGFGGWYFSDSLFGTLEEPFQNAKVSRLTESGDASRAAISPDGKMVAFVEYKKESRLLLKQIASGGTVEVVSSTNKNFLPPRFSPDGEFIYYSLYESGVATLFRTPTLGGESVEIVRDIDSYAAVSPDGKQIAFKRHSVRKGGDEIILIDSEGKNQQPIADTKSLKLDQFTDFSWSSDGRKILLVGFVVDDKQFKKFSARIVDAASKAIEENAWTKDFNESNWRSLHSFHWLRDNSGIIFVGMKNKGDHLQIYHKRFADNKLTKITNDISEYQSFSLSQDGKTIVTQKDDYTAGLISYDPQTKQKTTILAEDSKYRFWGGFTQTSDGKILFAKRNQDKQPITTVDEDGQNEKVFLAEKTYYYNPVFTSDGKYLVYLAADTGRATIWRANPDGSEPLELTEKGLGEIFDMEISPDNKTIYFTREKSDKSLNDMLKISIEGGKVEEVFPQNKTSERNLKFSPDGKYAAYHQYYFNPEQDKMVNSVTIAEFSEGKLSEPFSEVKFGSYSRFIWSPDSKSLTYTKNEKGFNIWQISIDGKNDTQLTDFDNESIQNLIWSNDNKKIILAEGKINSDLILIKEAENSAD